MLGPIRESIEKALVRGLPDLSLRNCHHLGLDSIALSLSGDEQSHQFVRMFVAWSDRHTLDTLHRPDGHYNIGVHNHRYDLTIHVVHGTLINHRVILQDDTQDYGPLLYEHTFSSGVNGTLSLSEPRKRYIDRFYNIVLGPGRSTWMTSNQLHTVIVPKKGEYTAWIVSERFPAQHESLLYSPIPQPEIDTSDLYLHMPIKEAENIVCKLLAEETGRHDQ